MTSTTTGPALPTTITLTPASTIQGTARPTAWTARTSPPGWLRDEFLAATLACAILGGAWTADAAQPESAVACRENVGEPLLLEYGQHTTGCAFESATDLDRFTFAGTGGDNVRLRMRSLTGAPELRVEIRDPAGAVIDTAACDGGCCSLCSFAKELTLPQSGTYSLAVSEGNADEGGSYVLELDKTPPTVSPPLIPYDVPVTESIDQPTDVDFLAFAGTAGSQVRITLRSTSGAPEPRMVIRDPSGAIMTTTPAAACDGGCCSLCSFAVPLTLSLSGIYLLEVYDGGLDEGGTYEVGLQCLFGTCPQNRPPVFGAVTDKTVQPGGSLDFALTATDQNNGDALTFSAEGLPPGASLVDHGNGTATVTWTPDSGTFPYGDYPVVFRVTDNGFPALTDEAAITITAGSVNAPPHFDAIPAQMVEIGETLSQPLHATDTDGNALTLTVQHSPPGSSFTDDGGGSGTLTWTPAITQSGRYLVDFLATDDGLPSKTATMTVLITVPNARQLESEAACQEGIGEPLALAYGQHTTGCAFESVTDLDRFTFAGTGGDDVRLRMHSLTGAPELRVEYRDPSGAVIGTAGCDGGCCSLCSFAKEFTLPQDGTYSLAVSEGGADEGGSYVLELDKTPPTVAPPLIPYDVPVTESIDQPTDVDFLAFAGTAGSQVRITLRSTSGAPEPRMVIRDPSGAIMTTTPNTACDGGCCSLCTFAVPITLPASGNYLLEIFDGGLDEGGTYELSVECLAGQCPGVQTCGNGVLDNGEECDPGLTPACCTATCTIAEAGQPCRPAAGPCDAQESCPGGSTNCPADVFQPAGAVCRAAAGPCDITEVCTGAAATCPPDTFMPVSLVCRPSAGVCDVAETCSGTGPACPVNGFAPATTVCRASAGVCDVAESCTGSTAACPADAFASPAVVCRPAAGPCDPAETCTGSGAACPTDTTVACADSNPCTDDSCAAGGCVHTVVVGRACDDGSACTTGESCRDDGSCGAGTPVDCSSEADNCSVATCDPTTGQCVKQQTVADCNETCRRAADGTSCNLDDCNDDEICVGGICKGTRRCAVVAEETPPKPTQQPKVEVRIEGPPASQCIAAGFQSLNGDAVGKLNAVAKVTIEPPAGAGRIITKLARGRIGPDGKLLLRLRLNKWGLRLLKRAANGKLPVLVQVRIQEPDGRVRMLPRTITVSAPRRASASHGNRTR